MADPEIARQRELASFMFGGYDQTSYAVRFWDGSEWRSDPNVEPSFTLVLKHRGALRRMFWPPNPLAFMVANIYDDFEIEGDMMSFCFYGRYLEQLPNRLTLWGKLKLALRLFLLPKVEQRRTGRQAAELTGEMHSRERDRKAICYHYDTSNEFFEGFLGPTMVYTSGNWEDENDTLETAQYRKLDMMYTKLRLKPGERLLDIGCGWGTPVMHAAREYGVDALGVTLSNKQAELANKRIRDAGLSDKCRVEVCDYRDLDQNGTFDKIVMMEVGEHFGPHEFAGYFKKCYDLLKPGGQLLLQQITLFEYRDAPGVRLFSRNFIFPDGQLVHVNLLTEEAERAGLEVRDVECIREHYPKTLTRWLGNLEANRDALVAATDEATFRAFRSALGRCEARIFLESLQLVPDSLREAGRLGVSPVPLPAAGLVRRRKPLPETGALARHPSVVHYVWQVEPDFAGCSDFSQGTGLPNAPSGGVAPS
ncbi:MAG: cyclopropane-fatty-acyl-phospholipid synthase family protein [Gemmataceae bacterium]